MKFPAQLRLYFRWSASLAIAVLILRRFLYVAVPTLLPRPSWHPATMAEKWTGLTFAAFFDGLMILALLGSPLCLYLLFRLRASDSKQSQLWGDAVLLVALYALAALLLRPPWGNS